MDDIGKMNRRIEVIVPVNGKSAMGGPQKSFSHKCNAWAGRVVANEIPEGYVNQRLVVPKRYRYRIHYRSDITEAMQIVDDSITYNILTTEPVGLVRLFLEMLVEKVIE